MAFRGIDVRQSSGGGADRLVFRFSLKDSSGAKVTSGTTTLALYELQSDGTLKSYDFSDDTFKTTALTTATLSLTHRTGNNGSVSTGVWTGSLTTLTGFTAGNVYLGQVNNSSASPPDQERQFQYGGSQGDLSVTAAGYVTLAAAGLDQISVSDPGAPAGQTTLAKMLVGVWRALWKKQTMTATQAKRYADDGSTVNATSTVSDDGTTQTVGTYS